MHGNGNEDHSDPQNGRRILNFCNEVSCTRLPEGVPWTGGFAKFGNAIRHKDWRILKISTNLASSDFVGLVRFGDAIRQKDGGS